MKNYYRPFPFTQNENLYIDILCKFLKNESWHPINFKFWNPISVFRNRNNCKIITMHWPEGFWRSKALLKCYIKAAWFIFIFFIAKLCGYKWVFYAHNIVPHYSVKSVFLERLMRKFILRSFDLVLGVSLNTKNDLKLAFGTEGKKYELCMHGAYVDSYKINISRDEFRKKFNIDQNAKIILVMNNQSKKRTNRQVNEIIDSWLNLKNSYNVNLLMTGDKPKRMDDLIEKGNFYFIEGRIKDELLGDLFNSVDFLFLNYSHITTSGMFFLSIAFDLPTIVPNLPFFKLQANSKTTLFFNYHYPLKLQLNNIIQIIEDGWEPDLNEFIIMREKYNFEQSAKINANAFQSIIG